MRAFRHLQIFVLVHTYYICPTLAFRIQQYLLLNLNVWMLGTLYPGYSARIRKPADTYIHFVQPSAPHSWKFYNLHFYSNILVLGVLGAVTADFLTDTLRLQSNKKCVLYQITSNFLWISTLERYMQSIFGSIVDSKMTKSIPSFSWNCHLNTVLKCCTYV